MNHTGLEPQPLPFPAPSNYNNWITHLRNMTTITKKERKEYNQFVLQTQAQPTDQQTKQTNRKQARKTKKQNRKNTTYHPYSNPLNEAKRELEDLKQRYEATKSVNNALMTSVQIMQDRLYALEETTYD